MTFHELPSSIAKYIIRSRGPETGDIRESLGTRSSIGVAQIEKQVSSLTPIESYQNTAPESGLSPDKTPLAEGAPSEEPSV